MEIAPITGIRAMPAMKQPAIDPELTAVFDIEASARTGDDTYTGNGKKAAGAEENDEDESDEMVEELEEITAEEASSEARPAGSAGQISFFA